MRSIKSPSWTKRLAGLDPLAVPPHVFSMRERDLTYARFGAVNGQGHELEALEAVEIAPGTFPEGPMAGPIHDPAPIKDLVESIASKVSPAIQEASLVLPDSWLRIAFAEVENLPRNVAEREEILRWKLQRLVPFRVEELRLDATLLSSQLSDTETRPVMIAFAIEVMLEQLEALFAGEGIRLGQISNESLSLMAAVRDVLRDVELGAVVSVSGSSYALMFTLRGQPVLHRRKELGPQAEAGLDETLVLRDLRLTKGFLEERLRSPRIGRFVIAGAGEHSEQWSSWLEEVFNYPVVPLDGRHLAVSGLPGNGQLQHLATMFGAARQFAD